MTKLFKLLTLSILPAFLAASLGFQIGSLQKNPEILYNPSSGTIVFAGLLVLLTVSILAISGLFSLIAGEGFKNYLLSCLLMVIGFAAGNPTPVGILGAILLGLALANFGRQNRADYFNSIRLRSGRFLPRNSGFFTLILSVLLSLNFYLGLDQKIEVTGFTIPEGLIEKASAPVLKIIENNLGRELTRQFGEQFEQTIGTANEGDVLHFLQEELQETLTEGQGRQQFGLSPENLDFSQIQISPDGRIDVGPLLADLEPTILGQIQKMIEPYTRFIPVILAVMLLFTTHYLFSLFPYLVVPAFAICRRLLLSLGMIQPIEKSVTVERLELT